MNIKPIKTEKDYEKALKRLKQIFDASSKSKEGDDGQHSLDDVRSQLKVQIILSEHIV